jgi:hypothetical protein
MDLELIQSLFLIKLSNLQIYLLFFLLGSFTVATLSDLKHLSAQKEFFQIWILFVLVMLGTDIYHHFYVGENFIYFFIKWGLILLALPLCFHYLGKIAWGDVWAKMAACSLFSPFLILIFMVLITLINKLTRFIWKIWRKGNYYPFMPVILLTTLFLLTIFIFFN